MERPCREEGSRQLTENRMELYVYGSKGVRGRTRTCRKYDFEVDIGIKLPNSYI
jgi:hypothetical protein